MISTAVLSENKVKVKQVETDVPVTVEGEVDIQRDAVVNCQAHQLKAQQVKEELTIDT